MEIHIKGTHLFLWSLLLLVQLLILGFVFYPEVSNNVKEALHKLESWAHEGDKQSLEEEENEQPNDTTSSAHPMGATSPSQQITSPPPVWDGLNLKFKGNDFILVNNPPEILPPWTLEVWLRKEGKGRASSVLAYNPETHNVIKLEQFSSNFPSSFKGRP